MNTKIRDRYPVLWGCSVGILSLAGATSLGYLFRKAGFLETNFVLLYILGVLITAVFSRGFLYGMLTSVAATLAYNYFFTSPFHSLDVDNAGYLVTFTVMTIVSLVTSALTAGMRKNTMEARRREKESQELYNLMGKLTKTADSETVAAIVVESVSSFLHCNAACVYFDEEGYPARTFLQQAEPGKQKALELRNPEKYADWLESVRESFKISGQFYEYPVRAGKKLLGAIRIPREKASEFDESQQRFVHSAVECSALAFDRIHSWQIQIKSKQEMERERYRGNLLRAISHDIRTPLSGIMGTSELIMKMSEPDDVRYEMAEGIKKDAGWLHSLVENILSLTRLQSGPMMLKKEKELAEDIVGGAIEQMSRRAPEYDIAVEMPEEMLLVPMDGRLIMQVLVNLLDNSVKHTPQGKEIKVTVKKEKGCAVFLVSNRGEQIAREDLPQIFETFYTTRLKSSDAEKGIGLGLAICKSIVEAHGGKISARNMEGGEGVCFRFTLPLEEEETEE